MKSKLLVIITLFLISCSPKIRTKTYNSNFNKLTDNIHVFILRENNLVPENSIYIADLKIGDAGLTTDCAYNTVMELAKKEAKKCGANIIKIIKVKTPSLSNECYKITAKLYRNFNKKAQNNLNRIVKLRYKKELSPNENSAILYFYRPKKYAGSAIKLEIKEGENIVGTLKHRSTIKYEMKVFGEIDFTSTLKKLNLPPIKTTISLKKGKEYFIRCGIIGIAEKPYMHIVDNEFGIKEYLKLKE